MAAMSGPDGESAHPLPRLLFVGGAPMRLTEAAVLWHDHWCETVPSWFERVALQGDDVTDGDLTLDRAEVEAFVQQVADFDIICCESPEALVLHAELSRRGQRPPPLIALEVHGFDRVRLAARALYGDDGADACTQLLGSERVTWLAASDAGQRGLVGAGVEPARIRRLNASVFIYEVMLPDAKERLTSACTLDAELMPSVAPGAVVVPGTGRRDPATWLSAAALLPNIPFVSIGEPAAQVEQSLEALGLPMLPNLQVLPYVALEEYIALLRRARLCVVCVRDGGGDGGHTTVALAHALETPVIATRVPGVIDYVVDDHTARVVPPADPRALATGIRWLWEDRSACARLTRGGLEAEGRRRAISERGVLDMLHALGALR